MNKSFSVCSVFVWQLLSPASVASRWVWTQSETFQRTSKLRKRPPTKAFSSILTSHQTFRRKQRTFALFTEHTKKKWVWILQTIHEAISDEELDESSLDMKHLDLFSVVWLEGSRFSCRLQTKQGKVSFFPVLREWNEHCSVGGDAALSCDRCFSAPLQPKDKNYTLNVLNISGFLGWQNALNPQLLVRNKTV